MDLSGLRALVTGSTRGICRAIAARLASHGAAVAVNGRTEAKTLAAIADLQANDRTITFNSAAGDMSDGHRARNAFQAAGPVDILVNNIGVFEPQQAFEIEDEEWLDAFRSNVLTGVRATRHYGPQMAAAGFGRIDNIGSEAGSAPPTELIHYAASKAAQHAMSRGFAQALAGTGVTVNTVVVGPAAHEDATRVRRERAAAAGLSLEQYRDRFVSEHRPTSLLKRYVEADKIAGLVPFLVARDSGFMTGGAWRADGGTLHTIS